MINNLSTSEIDAIRLISTLNFDKINDENKELTVNKAIKKIVEFYDADHGYIHLTGKNGNQSEREYKFMKNTGGLVTYSIAVIDECLETGKTIIVKGALSSREFAGDPSLQRFNIETAVCVPIKTADDVLGVIYIDTSSDKRLANKPVRLLEFIGTHMGLALSHCDNRRLVESGKATLNLSHSVKNILQMIGGAAEVIDYGLKRGETERVVRSWNILSPNLERLRKFMLDMLNFSKDRKLEIESCDFNHTIKGSIELLKSRVDEFGAEIILIEDGNIPTVELDGERIHEMSLNLILNAMEIVDKQTGLVTVETRFLPNKNYIQLIVRDNGPGMTEEIKKVIFKPFESGNNKLGTGLGMAIAKQIVDQHKGSIEVVSEPGEGATFTVTLPAITESS